MEGREGDGQIPQQGNQWGLCLIWPWLVFVLDSEVSAGDCGLLFVSDSWCQHRTVHREVLVTIPWFN